MLRWALEHGEAYSAAQERVEQDGSDIPEELLPPDFLDGYDGWYADFFRLSTERQIGMAEGEIPASAIERHTAGWPYDDAAMFEHCMREMDKIYLARSEKPADAAPEMSAEEQFMAAFADRM